METFAKVFWDVVGMVLAVLFIIYALEPFLKYFVFPMLVFCIILTVGGFIALIWAANRNKA